MSDVGVGVRSQVHDRCCPATEPEVDGPITNSSPRHVGRACPFRVAVGNPFNSPFGHQRLSPKRMVKQGVTVSAAAPRLPHPMTMRPSSDPTPAIRGHSPSANWRWRARPCPASRARISAPGDPQSLLTSLVGPPRRFAHDSEARGPASRPPERRKNRLCPRPTGQRRWARCPPRPVAASKAPCPRSRCRCPSVHRREAGLVAADNIRLQTVLRHRGNQLIDVARASSPCRARSCPNLAKPAIFTATPPISTSAMAPFGKVSVVMMARAATAALPASSPSASTAGPW